GRKVSCDSRAAHSRIRESADSFENSAGAVIVLNYGLFRIRRPPSPRCVGSESCASELRLRRRLLGSGSHRLVGRRALGTTADPQIHCPIDDRRPAPPLLRICPDEFSGPHRVMTCVPTPAVSDRLTVALTVE